MTLFGANPVDVVVLVVVVASALLALVRGFVAEVLAIVGWVLAIFVSLYGLQPMLPYAEEFMGKGMTSLAVTVGCLFVATIAITAAISHVIAKQMKNRHLSMIDRSLGFLFGLIRGGLLVCLLYVCLAFVFPVDKDGEVNPDSMQAVLKSARTQPALAAGAELLASFAPDKSLSIEDLTKASPLEELMQPKPPASGEHKPDASATERGYATPAREGLEQMIESVGGEPAATPPPGPAPSGSNGGR